MRHGQGKGEVILLSLDDMVTLILDCIPAARRAASGVLVGVADGCILPEVMNNAMEVDGTAEALNAARSSSSAKAAVEEVPQSQHQQSAFSEKMKMYHREFVGVASSLAIVEGTLIGRFDKMCSEMGKKNDANDHLMRTMIGQTSKVIAQNTEIKESMTEMRRMMTEIKEVKESMTEMRTMMTEMNTMMTEIGEETQETRRMIAGFSNNAQNTFSSTYSYMQRFKTWLRNSVVHREGKKLTAEDIHKAFLSATNYDLQHAVVEMLAPLALNMAFTDISSSISSRNVPRMRKLVFYNVELADE